MRKLSWGQLPYCFLKDGQSGISVNAVAVSSAGAAAARESMPPERLACLLRQDMAAKSEAGDAFLYGYDCMRRRVLEGGEPDIARYLAQVLYHAAVRLRVCQFELTPLRQELAALCPALLAPFAALQAYPLYFRSTPPQCLGETAQFVILLGCRERCETAPSLYQLRRRLLQRGTANISVTLPDSSSFSTGALFALMQAAAAELAYLLAQEKEN